MKPSFWALLWLGVAACLPPTDLTFREEGPAVATGLVDTKDLFSQGRIAVSSNILNHGDGLLYVGHVVSTDPVPLLSTTELDELLQTIQSQANPDTIFGDGGFAEVIPLEQNDKLQHVRAFVIDLYGQIYYDEDSTRWGEVDFEARQLIADFRVDDTATQYFAPIRPTFINQTRRVNIASYTSEWFIDDSLASTSENFTPELSFDRQGTYRIKLRVTGPSGLTVDSTEQAFEVLAQSFRITRAEDGPALGAVEAVGGGYWVLTSEETAGNENVVLLRLDQRGRVLVNQSKIFDYSSDDRPGGLLPLEGGGMIITGTRSLDNITQYSATQMFAVAVDQDGDSIGTTRFYGRSAELARLDRSRKITFSSGETRIALVGTAWEEEPGGTNANRDVYLVLVRPDLSSTSNNGKISVAGSQFGTDITLGPDGALLLSAYGANPTQMLVYRLSSTGTLETGFPQPLGGGTVERSELIRPTNDGSFILGGYSIINGTTSGAGYRLDGQGQSLGSFASAPSSSGNDRFNEVLWNSEGAYLVAGQEDDQPYLAKFSSTGQVDWTLPKEGQGSFYTVISTLDGTYLAVGEQSDGLLMVKTDLP